MTRLAEPWPETEGGVDPVLIRKGNGGRQEMLLQSQEISVKEAAKKSYDSTNKVQTC